MVDAVVFVVANGAPFASLNVDVANGVVVAVGVPKVIPALVVPNGILEDVTVVPNVSPLVPVVIPKVGLENGPAVEGVASNCDVAVANGLLVVGVAVPNSGALDVDIVGAVLWAVPNMLTLGAGTLTPNAFAGWTAAELKVGVVVLGPPNMLPGPPNVGCSPNIDPCAFPKFAPPPKTGAPPKAGTVFD